MDINGVLIIDKPEGWTSHDVVAKLRGALRIKRIGHGGTLDPMATGVLPVFIGTSTRLSGTSTEADKEYIAGLKLGIVTDTQDTTGNVLSENDVTCSADELRVVLSRFLGPQKQIPPMYSAKKQGGKKLYELARKGIEVAREPRDINVFDLEILERQGDVTGGRGFVNPLVNIRVKCSKGTYVRTLCHDIGASLGCGAAMSSLRRLKSGNYTIEDAHTLEKVLESIKENTFDKLLTK